MEKENYELINRLDDFIANAIYKHSISTTHFLNPFEQSLAVQKLKNINGIKFEIDGGYSGSERNIVIVYPDDNYTKIDDYLSVVKIDFTKFDTKYLEHRMILGSVLSLGIKREGIGDIIIDKTCAYIIATKKMAKYIDDHLLNVGHAHVSTTYIEDTKSINLELKKPAVITGTIASLRIDCVLALALKTSRTKANQLIKNQLVYINWQLVNKATLQVSENEIITVRKKGRIIVKEIGNLSRKNRIWIQLEIFGI